MRKIQCKSIRFIVPKYPNSLLKILLSQGKIEEWRVYSSRLKIPEVGYGKPCIAGRLREAEGCRPYRLRYFHLIVMCRVVFLDVASIWKEQQ